MEDATGDSHWLDSDDDFEAFSNTKPTDHSTIVKVCLEFSYQNILLISYNYCYITKTFKMNITIIRLYLVIYVCVKLVCENKEGVGDEKEVPHFVYISREKRENYHHHYKAGAMNFLVSYFSLLYLSIYVFLSFKVRA